MALGQLLGPAAQWAGRALLGGGVALDSGAFERFGSPEEGEVSMLAPIWEQPRAPGGMETFMGRNTGNTLLHDVPGLVPKAGRALERGMQRLPAGVREGARTLVGPNVGKAGRHGMKEAIKRTVPGAGKHITRKLLNLGPRALFGASAQLAATPFNALLEGVDAAGALPMWAGGTGMGNYGWGSERDFLRSTTFNQDNPTIFGEPDPTGGYLDYTGAALNAWSKPIRSTYSLGEGAVSLPGELLGAMTSGPSREKLLESERAMEEMEKKFHKGGEHYKTGTIPGLRYHWRQKPGEGSRPKDSPLTARDEFRDAYDKEILRRLGVDNLNSPQPVHQTINFMK